MEKEGVAMPDQVMEILADLRDRMARMETKLDRMQTVELKADTSLELAKEALQSTRSAHKRLNDVESDIKFLWRTVIGAWITGGIGLVFLIIQIFIKGGN
jgi:exonuclease VII small subunit